MASRAAAGEPSGSGGWTAEARELLALHPALGVPVPAYQGRCLANLLPSVTQALGLKVADGPLISPPLPRERDPFRGGSAEGTVVVLLVDALGWFPFARWSRLRGTRAAGPWGRAAPITSVFPTTTVAALPSLSSGTPPGRHGVVGPLLYVPELGQVVDVLRMSPADRPGREELVGPTWTPGAITGAPPLFGRGVPGTVVSRREFATSGFSRILYEGAEFVGYSTASDLAHLLTGLLERPHPPPLVCAYWDELDAVQHLRGPGGPPFEFEADRIEHLLAYVAAHVGSRARAQVTVVVSADHGQVPVDPTVQVRVDRAGELQAEMGRQFAGDRRAGFFAARPGRAEALREALEKALPEGRRIIAMADAVGAGLFGPPPHHPQLAERLGDWLVLMPIPTGLTGPKLRPDSRSHEFLASHGGLAPEELLVPLVAGRLGEFVEDRTSGAPEQG